MSEARKITDHAAVRRWAEERGGRPVVAKGTEKDGGGAGVLRFDFGEKEKSLEEIDWEAFFDTFERKKLALLAQDRTAGGELSRFFKFVER